jgi:hypothetical protein
MYILNIINDYIKKLDYITRIRSTKNGKTDYYLGKKYIDKYNDVISKYNKQILQAYKYPFNKDIIIVGK